MDAQADAIAQVARTIPGIRDVRTSLQNDYPELHVDTMREQAGLVGVTSRNAAETTLQATLGNVNTPGVWVDSVNGQSYYVVTSRDGASGSPGRVWQHSPLARPHSRRAQPSGEGRARPHADRGARHRYRCRRA